MKKQDFKVAKLEDFAVQNFEAQSNIQAVIKFLTREANRQKLTYRLTLAPKFGVLEASQQTA